MHVKNSMKSAKVAEVANAPHVVQFTNPRELFAVCKDFLAE